MINPTREGYLTTLRHEIPSRVPVGPVETAGLLIDYQNFFLEFYDAPEQIKKLLEVATESILRWILAQERVNGRRKHLIVIDHMASQITRDQFEELCFPYLERAFANFPTPPASIIMRETFGTSCLESPIWGSLKKPSTIESC